jgi:hypothetical protein
MAGRQFFRNEGRPAFQPETGFIGSADGNQGLEPQLWSQKKAGKTSSGLAGLFD